MSDVERDRGTGPPRFSYSGSPPRAGPSRAGRASMGRWGAGACRPFSSVCAGHPRAWPRPSRVPRPRGDPFWGPPAPGLHRERPCAPVALSSVSNVSAAGGCGAPRCSAGEKGIPAPFFVWGLRAETVPQSLSGRLVLNPRSFPEDPGVNAWSSLLGAGRTVPAGSLRPLPVLSSCCGGCGQAGGLAPDAQTRRWLLPGS